MNHTTDSRATKVLLALGSVGIIVGGAELLTLFGHDYRDLFGTPVKYEHSRYVNTDPELLYITRPNLRESGVQHGGDITRMWNIETDQASEIHWDMRLDRNGFRNPDAQTAARICVIGDSFVVGRPVSTSELMTTVLSNTLHLPVANLGQTGYGPQQEFIIAKRFALSYRPAVIVWALFEGNDLSDAMWFEGVREKWPETVAAEHTFLKRSMVNNAVAAIGRLLRPASESPLAGTRWGRLADGRRMWFHHEMAPWAEWELGALEVLVGNAVADGYRLCTEHGIRLVVVLIPDKFRVYRDTCTFPADSECRAWSLNDFPQRLESMVHQISPDIGFLDLTPSFRERASKGEVLYFPDDTHWNAAGHALAGNVLAAFLNARVLTR